MLTVDAERFVGTLVCGSGNSSATYFDFSQYGNQQALTPFW